MASVPSNSNGKPADQLERLHFDMSRAHEYLAVTELEMMAGQSREKFVGVIIKELVDNGMDAAEKAGVAPVIRITVERFDESVRITVQDNGCGITPDVVKRLCDFSTRTSDKAAYRAPLRGRLGNASMCILGMPFALGVEEPVVIASCGVRHSIRACIDPAGEVRVDRKESKCAARTGTAVTVTMPGNSIEQVNPNRWAREFAVYNPHATVHFAQIDERSNHGSSEEESPKKIVKMYRPTFKYPGEWCKVTASDKTSPWWYDDESFARLVFAHIGAARKNGTPAKLLRNFVREFRGLARSAQAKAVCDRFPGVERLSDFDGQPGLVGALLTIMKEVTVAPPKATLLGCVGKGHFGHHFAALGGGVKRMWYRKAECVHEGLPYVIEVAVAETREHTATPYCAVNYSPTFEDPIGQLMNTDAVQAYGFDEFLNHSHALQYAGTGVPSAAVLHVIGVHLPTLDKGKTHIRLPKRIMEILGDLCWSACRTLYQEERRRQRDAAAALNQAEARARARDRSCEYTLIQAVDLVMEEAVAQVSDNETRLYSAHTLYYHVRKLIQQYPTEKELTSHYFEQKLLPRWQLKHRMLPGLYYEPRGVLIEPHTGKVVPLGTREVGDYEFPLWLFDKIHFCEKTGFAPVFQEARLAEKYDIAICCGEGFASVAARQLLARAEKGHRYKIAVSHDGDPSGYDIARTIREATARMPGHSIEVVDIGLHVQYALDLGIEPETFTRRKALSSKLELTDLEREYFTGEYSHMDKKTAVYIAKRFELNALTTKRFLDMHQEGWQANGMTKKVIPDDEVLPGLGRDIYDEALADAVDATVDDLIDRGGITDRVVEHFGPLAKLKSAKKWIKEDFAADPYTSWEASLKARCRKMVADLRGVRDMVVELVQAALVQND